MNIGGHSTRDFVGKRSVTMVDTATPLEQSKYTPGGQVILAP